MTWSSDQRRLSQARSRPPRGPEMIKKIRQTGGNGINCPALHQTENERMIVSGPTVTIQGCSTSTATPHFRRSLVA